MNSSGIPDENQHFETVLSRLDALLRRDHVAGGTPDMPGQGTAPPMNEDDEIPVLTEVYEGDASFLKAGGREAALPPYAEFKSHPEKQTAEGGVQVQPDAYFGRLATLQTESLTQTHRLDEAVVDYDAIVRDAVTALAPQFQEVIVQLIEDEMQRARTQLQFRVVERMRDEIEPALQQRLQELLAELGLNRNETRGS